MPRKKKGPALGRNTPSSKRIRLSKASATSQETSEQRAHRLAEDAARKAVVRQYETSEQSAERRAADRLAHASAILRETEAQTTERRAANTRVQATARLLETEEETLQRQAADSQAHASAILHETDAESAERREAHAHVQATAILLETEEETLQRQADDAQVHASARLLETEEETLQRQAADAAAHARNAEAERTRRNAETVAQRRNRLAQAILRPQVHFLARTHNHPVQFSIGRCEYQCPHCSAYRFPNESLNCCEKGKVRIHLYNNFPEELKQLYISRDANSKNFKQNIRQFNSSMAFASMGAQLAPPAGNGPYCFRIHGQLYHRTGDLHPAPGQLPQYGQLYIIEGDQAVQSRLARRENSHCSPAVMAILHQTMSQCNPYVAAYAHMHEIEQFEEERSHNNDLPMPQIKMVFKTALDERRYNEPVHDEVAAVFVGQEGAPPSNHDVVVYPRGEPLHRISFLNPNLDPLVYPLLFPRGESGWSPELRHVLERQTAVRTRVTQLQFYSYKLAMRSIFSPLHHAGKLLQQYMVDAYCKTEAARLLFIRNNQSQLRVESYQGLIDYVNNRAAQQNLPPGRMVILPSTFNGSPRNMMQNFQDAMAVVGRFGRPDLFVTFTCNPKSPDILNALRPGQTASDRPDIVSRVFKLQLDELKRDLTQNHVLGNTVADLHVIEYQKRGLPHSHILITLDEESKPREDEDVDSFIRAEIPVADTEPELHELVKTHMMHGPCGDLKPDSVCMKNGECSKGFPKDFKEETVVSAVAFPLYRRRDDGRSVYVRGCHLDNRWVVPYSPWLLLKYGSHINVELCSSVKSLKYLFKYVYKGHDCASLEAAEQDRYNHDEVSTYLEARYVSAPEAMWRLSKFPLSHLSHTVTRLAVHLPLQQNVYLQPGQVDEALARAANSQTTLTAWFKLNQDDEQAHELLYPSIPQHYVWVAKGKKWKRRQRRGDKIVSRMYYVCPKQLEKFYLRLLLLHVPGVTGFEDLRTFNGHLYDSYKEACLARNLLLDDNEWQNALTEASTLQMPTQIRQLFVTIVAHCNPTNALNLWDMHWEAMSEDFAQRMSISEAKENALKCIQSALLSLGTSCEIHGLPVPVNLDAQVNVQPEHVDPEHEEITLDDLNLEQRAAADAILEEMGQSDSTDRARLFYIDGPGGTGKTATYNVLIGEAERRDLRVASCAWTGCAKELLRAGRTVHNLFKLPVPVTETSVCNIRPNSPHAEYLRSLDLILMDEASMIDVHAFHAIDKSLRDITQHSNVPFGGKLIVLGGDFRQVLPVVPHAGPAEIIEHCLKRSHLWQYVQVFPLTLNMRANQDERQFSDWLLQLGNGTLQSTVSENIDTIDIPEQCVSQGDLIDEIFPDFEQDRHDSVILAPKNDATETINEQVLRRLPGIERKYFSFDEAICETQADEQHYPLEFLHSITPTGMPPHCLKLKVGAIVILLRGLDNNNGLCNGTRLKVVNLYPNLIDAEIISGSKKGNRVFIPRIKLAPSDQNLPFVLGRRQFPVRLAFCITINKGQGQTYSTVGIYLAEPVFSHGQLYVAFSRARSFQDIKVKVIPTMRQGLVNGTMVTSNIVWRAALH